LSGTFFFSPQQRLDCSLIMNASKLINYFRKLKKIFSLKEIKKSATNALRNAVLII